VRLPPELSCPVHATGLATVAGDGSHPALACAAGCRFPVIREVPRFVSSPEYAEPFGPQWKRYRRTQLDSYTGTTISRDRLSRCLGGPLDSLRGKSVLEAGCGAGRFSEVLLSAGARVFAFDLSSAVEASHENFGAFPSYFVCQADVFRAPAAFDSFDVVLALGMLQHTPSPEAAIARLARHVRPGGVLVADHYRPLRNRLLRVAGCLTPRSLLRLVCLRLRPEQSLRFTAWLVRALLPAHRLLWRRGPLVDGIRYVWRRVSPVFDYYDPHPELGAHLEEWALLDTHDGLSDRYKHLRSVEQIRRALVDAGLRDVVAAEAGNGVEARGRRPL
jgi:SAM-dependent methyltransferase